MSSKQEIESQKKEYNIKNLLTNLQKTTYYYK